MAKYITTFGEALQYTIDYRWKKGKSMKTNLINSGHVLKHLGKGFLLKDMMTYGFWKQLAYELLDDNPLWTDSTCNRVTSAGSTVLRTVYDDDKTSLTARFPKIYKFKEGKSRYLYFASDEVERLIYNSIDPFDKPELADVIAFGAYTGCRITEILKLRVMDVDFGGNLIWVGGMKGRETKGNEVRHIPINERIESMLMKRVEGRAREEKVFGHEWGSYDAVNYWYKKVRNYSGFDEKYCFHCLRHSFATWLGESNSPKTVQALCGHKHIETTMRYCHATDRSLRAAIDSLSPQSA